MRLINLTLLFLALALPNMAQARDTENLFPIQDVMSSDAAKEKLNSGIKFYFGKKASGRTIGTYVANRKTNAFNKSDKEACEWVFISALMALQERAISSGGNAVSNIHSFYKKKEMHSTSKYECHAGAFMAGVALRGTVVKR